MIRRLQNAGLLCGLLLLSGCASSQKSTSSGRSAETGGTSGPVLTEESDASNPQLAAQAQELREIQIVIGKGNFTLAQSRTEKFEKRFPKSLKMAEARNLHGLILHLRKQPSQALNQFKAALELNPDSLVRQYILYNQATSQYELSRYQDARATLDSAEPNLLNDFTQLKFFYLKGLVFQKLSLPYESTRELLQSSRVLTRIGQETSMSVDSKDSPRETLEKLLDPMILQIKDLSLIESIYRDFEETPFSDLILFRLASLSLEHSKTDQAERALKTLIERYPQSSRYMDATQALRGIQNQGVVNPRDVGLLLPMTGKFSMIGYKALEAVTVAFDMFELKMPDSKVSLVIEDSGETAEQAIRALEKLYFDHHVVAIIGPQTSVGIEEVTRRAQELGVAIISLAQQPGIKSDYVFNGGVGPRHQAREIARFAVQNKGWKRLAILYPEDRFGKECADNFWEGVEEFGGQIVAVESYAPKETDFRKPVDRLGGLFYTEDRKAEIDALAAAREKHGITKRTLRTDPYFRLKPVITFDAVFIPDESKALAQVIPTFAYEGLEHFRFLGIGTWNSTRLFERVPRLGYGAFFSDTFVVQSGNREIRRFVTKFQESTGRTPSALEAAAFDAASILEQVLLTSSNPSRREIKDKLQQVQNFAGVTGSIRFNEGHFERPLKILTVTNKTVHEAKY